MPPPAWGDRHFRAISERIFGMQIQGCLRAPPPLTQPRGGSALSDKQLSQASDDIVIIHSLLRSYTLWFNDAKRRCREPWCSWNRSTTIWRFSRSCVNTHDQDFWAPICSVITGCSVSQTVTFDICESLAALKLRAWTKSAPEINLDSDILEGPTQDVEKDILWSFWSSNSEKWLQIETLQWCL